MTKLELLRQIDALPDDTEFFTQQGDNAWPAKLRVFRERQRPVAYVCIDMSELGSHRNFPEGYSGVVELPITK